VHNVIELCNHKESCYDHHSIVIMEHTPLCRKTSDSNCVESFFIHNKVLRIIAVERPLLHSQIYVASGLKERYHFSCLTMFLPELFESTLDSCAMEPLLWLRYGHICSLSYSYLWDITQTNKVPLNFWDSWYE
jgi:hypothetical protein